MTKWTPLLSLTNGGCLGELSDPPRKSTSWTFASCFTIPSRGTGLTDLADRFGQALKIA